MTVTSTIECALRLLGFVKAFTQLSKGGRTLIYLPRGMKGAPSYEVPSGVTKIEDYAFEGCTIEKIVLPIGMEEVGLSAFFECRASSVVFKDGRKLPQEIEEYLEMERTILEAGNVQKEIEEMYRVLL